MTDLERVRAEGSLGKETSKEPVSIKVLKTLNNAEQAHLQLVSTFALLRIRWKCAPKSGLR